MFDHSIFNTTNRAILPILGLLAAASAAAAPADGWIVWASNREDGRHEIYLAKADGSGVRRLTHSGARLPQWSPDGRWISYAGSPDSAINAPTRVMRWDGSEDRKIDDGQPEFWMWDGSGMVVRRGDDHYLVDPETGDASLMFRKSRFEHVADMELNPGGISRDGRWLVAHSDRYRRGYTGSNGAFRSHHAAVILDLTDPGKIYFFGGGCEPVTPPTGDWVYHVDRKSVV